MTVFGALSGQRVLPVVRESDDAAALDRATALLAAGCLVVELTTSTFGWEAVVVECVRRAPGAAFIGLGTVTTAAQADAAISAGAAFLVSPYPSPAVRPVAESAGVPFVEGGFTPGEIADAASRGPAKVFPAHVGGPAYVRSLRSVLPDARLIPTGGIGLDAVGDYLSAGAFAVGVGAGLPTEPAALAEVFRSGATGSGT